MGKLFYFPVVQNPDENWTMGEGRITHKMIESFMPPKSNFPILLTKPSKTLDRYDSIVLVCGPTRLKEELVRLFTEMDYRNYFIFN